ncbi:hypothetical protein [Amycolatopsis sp. lyj-346]|uniref:DprA-like winged helix domain-containing protein n=1 Tax=Amycolatopsis sp. lyj-346 TaxID=2789289 RepID=UPI00397D05E6
MARRRQKRRVTVGRSWWAVDVPLALGALLIASSWSAKLGWRWRHLLVPVYLWVLAGLTGLVIHTWWPTWWALPATLALLVAAALVASLLHQRAASALTWLVRHLVPADADAGERGVLDRPVEKVYAFGLVTAGGTWLTLTSLTGWNQVTWWVGLVLLVVFGAPWSWHRRIRSKGVTNRFTRAWPKRVADPDNGVRGLMHSKIMKSEKLQANGCLLTVELKSGETIQDAKYGASRLASLFGLRPSAVQISEDMASARRVKIRILPKDPWKAKLDHPVLCPDRPHQSLLGMDQRLDLGLLDDGEPQIVTLRHLLLVGQTGGGKSVLLESILMWLFDAGDVAVVGSDMASGATLDPWEPLLAVPLARDEDDSLALLDAVLDAVKYREGKLAEGKRHGGPDSFAPSPELPWLVAVFDEYPDLVEAGGEAVKKVTGRVAKRARKVGIRLILATQNPTKSDVGSTEMRAQLTKMSLALDEQQSKTLWGGARDLGWRSEGLGTGVFLVKDAEHPTPQQAKGYIATVAERNRFIKAHRAVPLDAGTAAIFAHLNNSVVVDADGTVPVYTGTVPLEAPRVTVRVPMQRPASKHDRVAELLSDAPVSPAHLREATGFPDSTLRRLLAELEAEGRARREGRGKWVHAE